MIKRNLFFCRRRILILTAMPFSASFCYSLAQTPEPPAALGGEVAVLCQIHLPARCDSWHKLRGSSVAVLVDLLISTAPGSGHFTIVIHFRPKLGARRYRDVSFSVPNSFSFARQRVASACQFWYFCLVEVFVFSRIVNLPLPVFLRPELRFSQSHPKKKTTEKHT